MTEPPYRSGDAIKCKHCGRSRVQFDGVCEKCLWDNDAGDYARANPRSVSSADKTTEVQ